MLAFCGDLIFVMIVSVTALLQVATFLDDCEFQDYINETGWWATQQEQQETIVSKTTDDLTSVANVVENDSEAHNGHTEVSRALFGTSFFTPCASRLDARGPL